MVFFKAYFYFYFLSFVDIFFFLFLEKRYNLKRCNCFVIDMAVCNPKSQQTQNTSFFVLGCLRLHHKDTLKTLQIFKEETKNA